MLEYGIAMSKRMARDELVFLEGELGAGKTTLARGILRGLGFSGSREESDLYAGGTV